MDSFLLTLLLTFTIALGGRDQLIVGQFSDAVGRSVPLLLVAIALAIAAFELGWEVRLKPMKEPTRSYVAIAVVLLARQISDAARFVIFAFAAQAVYPVTTIIGGAITGSHVHDLQASG